MTAITDPPTRPRRRSRRHGRAAGPSLARLTGVELRKLADTRAGLLAADHRSGWSPPPS